MEEGYSRFEYGTELQQDHQAGETHHTVQTTAQNTTCEKTESYPEKDCEDTETYVRRTMDCDTVSTSVGQMYDKCRHDCGQITIAAEQRTATSKMMIVK